MTDPENRALENRMVGMRKEELLDFYDEVLLEGNRTIEMNDHKECAANTAAQEKIDVVRAYVLKRLSH